VRALRVSFHLAGHTLYESEAYAVSSSAATSSSAYRPANAAATADKCNINENVELRFDYRHLKTLKKSRTPLKLVLEDADKHESLGFVLLTHLALFNSRFAQQEWMGALMTYLPRPEKSRYDLIGCSRVDSASPYRISGSLTAAPG
jgi:hypothetical protein